MLYSHCSGSLNMSPAICTMRRCRDSTDPDPVTMRSLVIMDTLSSLDNDVRAPDASLMSLMTAPPLPIIAPV